MTFNGHTIEQTDPIMALKAKADPDTVYLHEAMLQPDKNDFLEAMEEEITDQLSNGNFTKWELHNNPQNTDPKGRASDTHSVATAKEAGYHDRKRKEMEGTAKH